MSDLFVDNIKHQSAQGSGTITLGASGETIALASGASIGAGMGKVLQVVSTTSTTQFSTTSTTMVGLSPAISASITPSSTSNKILILCSLAFGVANSAPFFTIYRGGSDIIPSGTNMFSGSFLSDQYQLENASFNYLDSPSTTSATTYELYWKSSNGVTVYLGRRAFDTTFQIPTTITLMEIAG